MAPGEAYGLVGESGCGKSTTAFAAQALPAGQRPDRRRARQGGRRRRDRDERLRAPVVPLPPRVDGVPGPGSALNPTLRIGPQVIECFTLLGHKGDQAERGRWRRCAWSASPTRLGDGPLPVPALGGMQQRVVIAMALACDPQLLVLDEPTTGLDATVEAEVLDLVKTLRHETSAAILLIAHNLGVIRSMCDRAGVMYAGKLVEEGPAQEVFDAGTPTPWGCSAAYPGTASARTSGRCSPSGHAAPDRRRPPGVRLRAALRHLHGHLPHRTTSPRGGDRRALHPLPPLGPSRRDP